MLYLYNGIYSAIKKNAALLFVTIWMDPESIMLSEMSDKDKYRFTYMYLLLYVESKKHKINKHAEQNKNHIDRENRLVVTRGERGGEG